MGSNEGSDGRRRRQTLDGMRIRPRRGPGPKPPRGRPATGARRRKCNVSSRKTQQKMEKLAIHGRHAAHTAFPNQLLETACPPEPDGSLEGGRENQSLRQQGSMQVPKRDKSDRIPSGAANKLARCRTCIAILGIGKRSSNTRRRDNSAAMKSTWIPDNHASAPELGHR